MPVHTWVDHTPDSCLPAFQISLPYKLCVLLKKKRVHQNLIWAAHILMGVGRPLQYSQPTGHTLRGNWLSLPRRHQLSTALLLGTVPPLTCPPKHADLILCRSWEGKHDCSEFRRAAVLLYPEDYLPRPFWPLAHLLSLWSPSHVQKGYDITVLFMVEKSIVSLHFDSHSWPWTH